MIRKRLKGAAALFIPVFSMRSYEAGKYKLNCDGNMARVLSIVYGAGVKLAHIAIPSEDMIDEEDFKELLKRIRDKGMEKEVEFFHNVGYGANAAETRKSNNILSKIDLRNEYDLYIIEPQRAITDILNFVNDASKIIYWCVASETISYSPWFTRDYKVIDKMIASMYETACATETQVKYLEGKSYKDEFYNPEFSDMKIVFFPFRLSDKSYKFDLLKEMILKLRRDGIKNFKVLVTDPNQSGEYNDIQEILCVPSNSALYISILKGKPIIPYFEMADEIKHISIEEMCMYKCDIICYDNKEIKNTDNIFKVHDDEEFYNILKDLIMY